MDKSNSINSTTPLSLDKVLKSYNILLFILSLFIGLVIMLAVLNPKGFNKSFGYEFFITGPMLIIIGLLIKEIFAFKSNPSESWFSKFQISTKPFFIPLMIALIIIIIITSFFSILTIGGVFSDKPPENNTEMIINFIVIILFIGIYFAIYKKSSDQDESYLHNYPRNIQHAFDLRK